MRGRRARSAQRACEGNEREGASGGLSLGGHDAAGVLGRRRPDHLDQHPPLRRQRGRHRARLPLAAAAGSASGASCSAPAPPCCCASSSPSSSPRSWAVPFLKLVGGLLLLWIAVKLIVPSEEHGEDSVKAGDTLWRAVWLVTIADIVMSLDNVIAIAAAAETAAMRVDIAHALAIKTTLIMFGLATSVPLIIAGQRAADEGAGTLPDPGLGRRRAARLGRGRDHDQGRRRGRLSRRRSSVDKLHLWAAAAGAVFVVGARLGHPARASTRRRWRRR